jgi:hypothetical protein
VERWRASRRPGVVVDPDHAEKLHAREPETSVPTGRDEWPSAAGEGRSRTARTNGIEESDRSIVPMNQPNKAEQSAAEAGESRERTEEKISVYSIH